MLFADVSSGPRDERLLHHALAVVERAGDAKRTHVVAERPELMRLAGRHAAVGIEDDHAETRAAVKRGTDRGSGVAGRRDENRGLPAEPRQALGEKPRAKVFERGCRAVKQLEHPSRSFSHRTGAGNENASKRIFSSAQSSSSSTKNGASTSPSRAAGMCSGT